MNLSICPVKFNIHFGSSFIGDVPNRLNEIRGFGTTLEKDVFTKKEDIPQYYNITEGKLVVPKRGQIIDETGFPFNRNTTNLFRDDLDWKGFGNYLEKRFKNTPKVNTYMYACSSGSEAFSLTILLQDRFGEDANKFFPIKAKDLDERVVQRAKKRQAEEYSQVNGGKILAKRALGLSDEEVKKYFKDPECPCERGDFLADSVKEHTIFSEANILEDIDKIDSKTPCIVMMRNMWPYVNPKEYGPFAAKLYKKLAPGSCVVIGDFDVTGEKGMRKSHTFPKALKDAGFKQLEGKNVSKEMSLIFEKN